MNLKPGLPTQNTMEITTSYMQIGNLNKKEKRTIM